MNTLNRPLFQRYARRPAPQGPVGIMASSPELMQAAARYNLGGLVERDPSERPDPFSGITPMPLLQPNPPLDKNLGGGNPLPLGGGNFLSLGMFQAPKNTTQHLEDIGNSVGGIQEDIRRAGVNINTASGNLDTARSMLGIEEPSGVELATTIGLAEGGPVLGYRRGTVVQPTVDITQEPIEFQETVTDTEVATPATPGSRAGVIIGETTDSAAAAPEPAPDNSDADKLAAAEKLGAEVVDKNSTPDDKKLTPSEESGGILAGLGKPAPKGTKGKISAMKDLIKETFGVDASRYDNLKSLNRAMVGFAIAEGGDIASALKQGAAGAAAIEEKSLARDDSMSQMALQQVFAEKLAGMRASRSGATGGSNKSRNPINAYQDALGDALRQAQDPVVSARIRKSGQTIEEWADAQARNVVEQSYTPDQLVGTRFAQTGGVDITTPTVTGVDPPEIGTKVDETPTTPGARFKDSETGKIMVVGEDGVAREE